MQDPAQLAVAFDSYFIHFTQNFPLTTAKILEVDDSKPSFSIQPISEPKIRAIIHSLKNSTAKDIYGMDSKIKLKS